MSKYDETIEMVLVYTGEAEPHMRHGMDFPPKDEALILEALRDAAAREKGCEDCVPGSESNYSNSFCPRCGRKL